MVACSIEGHQIPQSSLPYAHIWFIHISIYTPTDENLFRTTGSRTAYYYYYYYSESTKEGLDEVNILKLAILCI